MKPASKTVAPSTLSLDTIRALAAGRKEKGDGRLAAIIERGDQAIKIKFPSTLKQAADPKNKNAKVEIDKLVYHEIGTRAEKFLKANP